MYFHIQICVKHTHVVSYYSELEMYQSIVWAW
jgi:hypothetical protein